MAVTAKQLSKKGARGKELDALVREQLLLIDDRLLRQERTWGRNVLRHELPTGYSLPGLEKRDAQRIIYSAIIRSLQDRGFVVRLGLEEDQTLLYLEWVTDINREEVDAMNRLIRSVRLPRSEVAAFLAQTEGTPPPLRQRHSLPARPSAELGRLATGPIVM
ncbi:MAG: hypothetical protein L7S63_09370 [Flavobacteriales bacterium]|jgi:hypothetical protein|nr:hypothetical protein [Flavobacteriales bacterium]